MAGAPPPPLLDPPDLTQQEAWARVGARHRAVGAMGVWGTAWTRGPTEETTTALGVMAWTSFWATLRAEGAVGLYEDERSSQLGATVILPMHLRLSLELGLVHTALRSADTQALSGQSGATVHLAWGDLAAGGRLGSELRPLRMTQATVWNSEHPLGDSAWTRLVVPIGERFSGVASYEWITLQPTNAPANADPAMVHSVVLGMTFANTSATRR